MYVNLIYAGPMYAVLMYADRTPLVFSRGYVDTEIVLCYLINSFFIELLRFNSFNIVSRVF